MRKQKESIGRTIMLRIGSDQGSPGDHVFKRHFVEQIPSIIQTTTLRIHIKEGIKDDNIMFENGVDDVGMDDFPKFGLSQTGAFFEQ